MASCPDPTTHMLCVLEQVICTSLTWAQRPGYMSFLKGLPVISIKVYTFVVKGVHFVPNWFSPKDSSTYISSSLPKKFLCHIWSFLCYEINHNVEGQLIFFPSEATVGRAGNAVLPGICSRQQAVLSRWYNVSQVKVIHFAVLLKYYFIILSGYRILGETQNYIDRPHY